MNVFLIAYLITCLAIVNTSGPYYLKVLVHLEGRGDVVGLSDNWVGTKGQSRRLELINIDKILMPSGVSLEYYCHLQNFGDTPWITQGRDCGTRGQSRRLEGFAIRLTGPNANQYTIKYRCHLQNIGDTSWKYNGQYCGTKGQSRRLEAVYISFQVYYI